MKRVASRGDINPFWDLRYVLNPSPQARYSKLDICLAASDMPAGVGGFISISSEQSDDISLPSIAR